MTRVIPAKPATHQGTAKPATTHQGTAQAEDDTISDGLSNLSLTETTPAKVSMVTTCEDTSTPMRESGDPEPAEGREEEGGGVEVLPTKDIGTPKQATYAAVCGVCKVTPRTIAIFEQEGQKAWVR